MTVLKHADDKQPQLDALEGLLSRPDIDPRVRKLIDEEIWSIRLGRKAESEAAYDINFAYADRDSYAVIHDLRLEVGSRVAQIDHLILNRVLDVWVCETKGFSQGVKIDEQGYWRRYIGGRTSGMSSPVLQNENHIRVLRDLFDSGAIEVPRRMGLVPIKPRYFPVVLISNSAKLDLPRSRAARQAIRGLETVIKSEELHKRILDSFDDNIRTLRAMPKVVSASAVMDLGRQLVSLHRPKMPDFAAMFGLRPLEPSVTERASDPAQPPLESAKNCELCGRPLSGRVLAYLGEHRAEFGGASLCFECQRLHRRSRTESTA